MINKKEIPARHLCSTSCCAGSQSGAMLASQESFQLLTLRRSPRIGPNAPTVGRSASVPKGAGLLEGGEGVAFRSPLRDVQGGASPHTHQELGFLNRVMASALRHQSSTLTKN